MQHIKFFSNKNKFQNKFYSQAKKEIFQTQDQGSFQQPILGHGGNRYPTSALKADLPDQGCETEPSQLLTSLFCRDPN